MKSITLKAECVGELTKMVDEFTPNHDVVSITYRFNTIEYYKTLDSYVEAFIEYKN